MKYRKRPVEIEAIQYTDVESFSLMANTWGAPFAERAWLAGFVTDPQKKLVISTLEGTMEANVGDFIIRGIKGEFYPCRADIFEATYDKVES